jgi:NAD(P)-dependent dehydrogenase (short-subunit alcohol dehydrogenase family)
MKNKILIIGGNSKLARKFIQRFGADYSLHVSYYRKQRKPLDNEIQYSLDLSNSESINSFISKLDTTDFTAVLFFASTYSSDMREEKPFNKQLNSDMAINALGPYEISRKLQVEQECKLIFFGDTATHMPRSERHSYSLSKNTMEYVVKCIATERPEKIRSFCFRLGPTLAPESSTDPNKYYNRNLIHVHDAADGLVEYINFLINAKNLSSTGGFIDYDGGSGLIGSLFGDSIE